MENEYEIKIGNVKIGLFNDHFENAKRYRISNKFI